MSYPEIPKTPNGIDYVWIDCSVNDWPTNGSGYPDASDFIYSYNGFVCADNSNVKDPGEIAWLKEHNYTLNAVTYRFSSN